MDPGELFENQRVDFERGFQLSNVKSIKQFPSAWWELKRIVVSICLDLAQEKEIKMKS